MAERVDKLLAHGSLAKPLLSTFHSFCVRLLRRDIEALRIGNEGLTRTFAIYDESDQQSLVKQVMRRMGLDDKQLTPRVVLGRISWAKNHMLDPQEYYLGSADPTSEKVAHIFEAYRQELRKANALDFDDLLLEAVRVLKSSAEVRERYNRRYRYLLIDEYQDTNRPQYELMKLLAGPAQNVCVVGDEDQSIYSWRGADIKNILEFEKDFPSVKTVRLEQNYRSTQMILEAAGAVVARNAQRKGKHLWTARQGGSKIGYYEAPDGENEALFIADQINKYLRKAGEESGSGECLARLFCIAPTRSRAWWKKLCAAMASATRWLAGSRSTTAPRSKICSAISSWCRTSTTRSRCSGWLILRRAVSARPRWRRSSGSLWKRGRVCGRRLGGR